MLMLVWIAPPKLDFDLQQKHYRVTNNGFTNHQCNSDVCPLLVSIMTNILLNATT